MKAKITLSIVVSSALEKIKRTWMKVITLLILFVFGSLAGWAQHNVLSVGSTSSLTITSGTLFSADSLVLTPTGNFTMASNTILETPVPSPGYPNGTIDRVYYLNNRSEEHTSELQSLRHLVC